MISENAGKRQTKRKTRADKKKSKQTKGKRKANSQTKGNEKANTSGLTGLRTSRVC